MKTRLNEICFYIIADDRKRSRSRPSQCIAVSGNVKVKLSCAGRKIAASNVADVNFDLGLCSMVCVQFVGGLSHSRF